MKKIIVMLFASASAVCCMAQSIGIGAGMPDPSSRLDISTTTGGMLIPRMSTAQRDEIVAPSMGLQILNLDDFCLDMYDGEYWLKKCGIKLVGTDTFPGGWTERAGFIGSSRFSPVAFTIGDKGYVGAGSGYTDFWEFNPITNAWMQKADFIGEGRSGAIGFSIQGKGYLGTGNVYNGLLKKDFYQYNPVDNTWVQKQDFGGAGRNGAVGFSVLGKGYVGTGQLQTGYTKDFWEYDPLTDAWIQKADFGGPVLYGAFGLSIQNKGYVGTGLTTLQSGTTDFWEYDPIADAWTQKADFPGTGRFWATGFAIDHMGYIGLGYKEGVKMDFWQFNALTGNWSMMPGFKVNSGNSPVGFSIGNKGYVYTGLGSHNFWEFGLQYPVPFYQNSSFSDSTIVVNDGVWMHHGTNVVLSPHPEYDRHVGLGVTNPLNDLDIHSGSARTGVHPVGRPLYATTDLLVNSNGVEFRHSNGSQGIGFGSNIIYAAGSNNDQDLRLSAKGNSAKLIFSTNGTERMHITDSDYSGFGIFAPVNKVDIHSGSPRTGTHPIDRPLYVTGDISANSNGVEFRNSNGTSGIGFGFNTIYASGSASSQHLGVRSRGETGSLIFSTDAIEKMRIAPNSHVGIGLPNPLNRLDIQSGSARVGDHPDSRSLYVTGDIGATTNGVEFRNSSGTQGVGIGHSALYAAGSDANQSLGLSDLAGKLVFKTNGVERMHITGNGSGINFGRIGIAVPNPLHIFSVGTQFGINVDGSMRFGQYVNRPIHMYHGASGAIKMALSHSPAYPYWGLQYNGTINKFEFLADSFPVMSVNLGDNSVIIEEELKVGYIRIYGEYVNVPPNSSITTTCDCPAGTVVLGGDFFVSSTNVVVTINQASSNTQWMVKADNLDSVGHQTRANAICARLNN